MSKAIQRILSVLICIVLLFGAVLPGSRSRKLSSFSQIEASAADIVSGNCGDQGDNVTWTLNTKTGALVISGAGAMYRYAQDSEVPWINYRSIIRTAAFGSGVTNVGVFCLNKCSNLIYVTISGDVTRIENHAFRNCNYLKDIYYAGSREQWEAIYVGNGNTSLPTAAVHCNCIDGVLEVPYTSTDNRYPINVTYHQTDARSMLSRINDLRTGGNAWYWNSDNMTKTVLTDLSPLQYDYELEKVAMQRAAEIVMIYSHTRPNGSYVNDLYAQFDLGESTFSFGENIAHGQKTADEVETRWEEEDRDYDDQGHRRNILNSVHTAIGIACAEYNGHRFWVQEFRSPTSSAVFTDPKDGSAVVTVEMLDQYIISNTLYTAAGLALTVGERTALPAVNHCVTSNTVPEDRIPVSCEKTVEWSSSNPAVAQISGSDVVAVSNGRTTLTGTFDGGKTITVTISVTGGSIPAYAVIYNANGAVSGAVPQVQIKMQGDDLTLAANTGDLVKPGYTLDGWATEADGAKVYDLGASYTADASVTLYAHWEANAYTVRFNGNGATTGSMREQAFTYDVMQALAENAFERAYTVTYRYNGATTGNEISSETADAAFNGWATAANGAKAYNDKQNVKNLAESGTCDLYAVWTPGTVVLPAPTKTDCFFAGWYADASLTVYAGAAGSAYTPDDNVILYAKWTDIPVTLTGIAVKTTPSQTVYQIGEPFDQSGLTLTATYSDGSAQTVTSGFSCTGFDSAAAGTKTITVNYEGETTTFTVTVLPPDTLQSIAVTVGPAKTIYSAGEAFDKTGLKVTGTYSVSGTKEITDYTLSSPDMTTAGVKTITVSFEGKTTAFSITVQGGIKAVSVSDITINYKASAVLKPTVTADAGAVSDIRYASSNANVAAVDANGKVTGLKRGTATITCTVTDPYGNSVHDTCKVTVSYTPLQWIIIILLFGWIWY